MTDGKDLFPEKMNPNDEFVLLLDWRVEDGRQVTQGEVIAVLESSKASYEFESPYAGYLEHVARSGDRISFGEPLGRVHPTEVYVTDGRRGPSPPVPKVTITAKAQRLMDRHGIRAAAFVGLTQIRETDVQELLGKLDQPNATPGELRALEPNKEFEVGSLRRARANFIHSSVTREVRFSSFRAVIESFASRGLTLSIGELAVWATAQALKKFPLLNSMRTQDGVFFYDPIHIGVAINLRDIGLKCPVIHDAGERSLEDTSASVKKLALKYLRGDLKPGDMSGSTFTVTDLSSHGVRSFEPVVAENQAAILGVCSPDLSSTGLNLVLSFNHEIIDGMVGARFLAEIEKQVVLGAPMAEVVSR